MAKFDKNKQETEIQRVELMLSGFSKLNKNQSCVAPFS